MSKWSAMAAQTKTAGGAVTPEPLQNAEAESWDGEAYPRGSSRYKVPLFDSVKATRVSGFIEADAPPCGTGETRGSARGARQRGSSHVRHRCDA